MIEIKNRNIGVIIPALDEETTIKEVILGFHKYLPSAEICVVDNASTDNTYQIAEETLQSIPVKGYILKELSLGKGNALRRAFIELDWDIYITVDADLTYDPKNILELIEPVISNKADIVVGDRHSNNIYKNQNDRRFHEFGNRLVRKLINIIFNTNLNDIFSGYRVLNKRFAKNMPIITSNFEIETEMTICALIYKFRIKEIPINYLNRISGSVSKLNTISDGAKIIKALLMIIIDYKPLSFFGSLSLILFIASLAIGTPVINEYILTKYITHVPLAILATGTMITSLLFFAVALILNVLTRSNLRTILLKIQNSKNQ